MELYFLSFWRNAADLSGYHGAITDGRYHKQGTDCIYCYESRALAVMENRYHNKYNNEDDTPGAFKIVKISVPDGNMLELSPADIPGWRDKIYNEKVRNYVHELLMKGDWLLIKLPSSKIPHEFLYILNTRHPLMTEVKIADTADSRYPD